MCCTFVGTIAEINEIKLQKKFKNITFVSSQAQRFPPAHPNILHISEYLAINSVVLSHRHSILKTQEQIFFNLFL